MTSTVAAPPDPRTAAPAPSINTVVGTAARGAARRELRRVADLFAAVSHTDITVRLRVLAHARECLAVLHRLAPDDGGGLVRRADDLLARFPVFDTVALAATFRTLADVASPGRVAGVLTPDDVLDALPRSRRLAWLGHLLASVPPGDRDAVLEQTTLRRVWRLAGERRFLGEVAVLDLLAAGGGPRSRCVRHAV